MFITFSPCAVGTPFVSKVYLSKFIVVDVPFDFVIVPTGIHTNLLPFVVVSVASSITIPLSTVVALFVSLFDTILNPAGITILFIYESSKVVFSVVLNTTFNLSAVNSGYCLFL